jgi:hypothetical protein
LPCYYQSCTWERKNNEYFANIFLCEVSHSISQHKAELWLFVILWCSESNSSLYTYWPSIQIFSLWAITKSSSDPPPSASWGLKIHETFFYFCSTGIELKASCLLGRYTTTWAPWPAFFQLTILDSRILLYTRLAQTAILLFVLSHMVRMTEACHNTQPWVEMWSCEPLAQSNLEPWSFWFLLPEMIGLQT